MKNNIITISGPTATGKTSLSIQIAKEIDAEIVNFDSLLFYKELSIGTAKPDAQEMENIPHHMIDVVSIKTPLNASRFVESAIPIINECHKRGKTVILVGGSGFYLQALLKGMYSSKTPDPMILERSKFLYETEGISPFLDLLKKHDSSSFERYHENDHYRIRRAVEHFWTTRTPFSKAREEMKQNIDNSPQRTHKWNVFNTYINIPKEEHWPIIQKRTLKMLNSGLINEVKGLLNAGFNKELKPLQSIGYKETIDYIQGSIETEELLIEKIDINTRRLAKAQRTWFKKQDYNNYHALNDKDLFLKNCETFLR